MKLNKGAPETVAAVKLFILYTLNTPGNPGNVVNKGKFEIETEPFSLAPTVKVKASLKREFTTGIVFNTGAFELSVVDAEAKNELPSKINVNKILLNIGDLTRIK